VYKYAQSHVFIFRDEKVSILEVMKIPKSERKSHPAVPKVPDFNFGFFILFSRFCSKLIFDLLYCLFGMVPNELSFFFVKIHFYCFVI